MLFFSCFILLNQNNGNSSIHNSVIMFILPNNTKTNVGKNLIPSPNMQKPGQVIRRNNADYQVMKKKEALKKLPCDINQAKLKVYMYDLPTIFHFGLLDWIPKNKNQTWPDVEKLEVPKYPGGLNIQHSVEYWLTLDLLASTSSKIRRPCYAIRVNDTSLANVFFVPFFSSVSYNRHSKLHGKEKVSRNRYLQDELVKYLRSREEWKRYGGKDHIILAHHPNSLLTARKKLSSAIFLLSDFGRYPAEIANISKDIVAPYVHVVDSIGKDSASFDERTTLVYFQGAIVRKDGGMIRQELHKLLKDEKDVHFTYGSARGKGIKEAGQGMLTSKFCLNIAGDTPSSNRLFDSIVSHCVPVIISDEIELPFEDVFDYTEFSVFIRASDSVKKGFLMGVLRGINQDKWTKMWRRLIQISHHFEYQYPSKEGDAIQMIWEEVAHKISSIQLKINKEKRFLPH